MPKDKKLPRTGVYLNAKEWQEQLDKHEAIEQIVPDNETLLEIRIEGRIGYHDLQDLLASQKKSWRKEIASWSKKLKEDLEGYEMDINAIDVISENLDALKEL